MEKLNKDLYHKVTNHLKQVKINNLFARSVVEGKVQGDIFVDNFENPSTFYVVHPYSMSLLFGNPNNQEFNKQFLNHSLNAQSTRKKHIWMQAYPHNWHPILNDMYGDNMIKSEENDTNQSKGIVELNGRVNFKFDIKKYNTVANNVSSDCKIIRTDTASYNNMKGTVIPSFFWKSDTDFIKNGVGFSLYCNNSLASTAYSAFIHDNKLEIGIETIPEFRGRGFAQLVCSALIDYCIENNYEPIWSCRADNHGSINLANKLGFRASFEVPYYRLSN